MEYRNKSYRRTISSVVYAENDRVKSDRYYAITKSIQRSLAVSHVSPNKDSNHDVSRMYLSEFDTSQSSVRNFTNDRENIGQEPDYETRNGAPTQRIAKYLGELPIAARILEFQVPTGSRYQPTSTSYDVPSFETRYRPQGDSLRPSQIDMPIQSFTNESMASMMLGDRTLQSVINDSVAESDNLSQRLNVLMKYRDAEKHCQDSALQLLATSINSSYKSHVAAINNIATIPLMNTSTREASKSTIDTSKPSIVSSDRACDRISDHPSETEDSKSREIGSDLVDIVRSTDMLSFGRGEAQTVHPNPFHQANPQSAEPHLENAPEHESKDVIDGKLQSEVENANENLQLNSFQEKINEEIAHQERQRDILIDDSLEQEKDAVDYAQDPQTILKEDMPHKKDERRGSKRGSKLSRLRGLEDADSEGTYHDLGNHQNKQSISSNDSADIAKSSLMMRSIATIDPTNAFHKDHESESDLDKTIVNHPVIIDSNQDKAHDDESVSENDLNASSIAKALPTDSRQKQQQQTFNELQSILQSKRSKGTVRPSMVPVYPKEELSSPNKPLLAFTNKQDRPDPSKDKGIPLVESNRNNHEDSIASERPKRDHNGQDAHDRNMQGTDSMIQGPSERDRIKSSSIPASKPKNGSTSIPTVPSNTALNDKQRHRNNDIEPMERAASQQTADDGRHSEMGAPNKRNPNGKAIRSPLSEGSKEDRNQSLGNKQSQESVNKTNMRSNDKRPMSRPILSQSDSLDDMSDYQDESIDQDNVDSSHGSYVLDRKPSQLRVSRHPPHQDNHRKDSMTAKSNISPSDRDHSINSNNVNIRHDYSKVSATIPSKRGGGVDKSLNRIDQRPSDNDPATRRDLRNIIQRPAHDNARDGSLSYNYHEDREYDNDYEDINDGAHDIDEEEEEEEGEDDGRISGSHQSHQRHDSQNESNQEAYDDYEDDDEDTIEEPSQRKYSMKSSNRPQSDIRRHHENRGNQSARQNDNLRDDLANEYDEDQYTDDGDRDEEQDIRRLMNHDNNDRDESCGQYRDNRRRSETPQATSEIDDYPPLYSFYRDDEADDDDYRYYEATDLDLDTNQDSIVYDAEDDFIDEDVVDSYPQSESKPMNHSSNSKYPSKRTSLEEYVEQRQQTRQSIKQYPHRHGSISADKSPLRLMPVTSYGSDNRPRRSSSPYRRSSQTSTQPDASLSKDKRQINALSIDSEILHRNSTNEGSPTTSELFDLEYLQHRYSSKMQPRGLSRIFGMSQRNKPNERDRKPMPQSPSSANGSTASTKRPSSPEAKATIDYQDNIDLDDQDTYSDGDREDNGHRYDHDGSMIRLVDVSELEEDALTATSNQTSQGPSWMSSLGSTLSGKWGIGQSMRTYFKNRKIRKLRKEREKIALKADKIYEKHLKKRQKYYEDKYNEEDKIRQRQITETMLLEQQRGLLIDTVEPEDRMNQTVQRNGSVDGRADHDEYEETQTGSNRLDDRINVKNNPSRLPLSMRRISQREPYPDDRIDQRHMRPYEDTLDSQQDASDDQRNQGNINRRLRPNSSQSPRGLQSNHRQTVNRMPSILSDNRRIVKDIRQSDHLPRSLQPRSTARDSSLYEVNQDDDDGYPQDDRDSRDIPMDRSNITNQTGKASRRRSTKVTPIKLVLMSVSYDKSEMIDIV